VCSHKRAEATHLSKNGLEVASFHKLA